MGEFAVSIEHSEAKSVSASAIGPWAVFGLPGDLDGV